MALYTFVGIFCSFIAVDITKSLISKNASGFPYFLNLLAVASLSIVLANLLGLAWFMAYSEFFVKAWFPEMYQLGQMLIAFLGASIWMSIFFVPLFHYLHIRNKVQYKKWIYSAFLIVIIALPLSFAFQNGKSVEDNLPSNNKKLSQSLVYICYTGIENIFIVAFIDYDRFQILSFIKQQDDEDAKQTSLSSRFGDSLEEKIKVNIDKNNYLTFATGQNTNKKIYFELVRKNENIFYEYSNQFMKLNGRCVSYDGTMDSFAVAKFLKSQDMTN